MNNNPHNTSMDEKARAQFGKVISSLEEETNRKLDMQTVEVLWQFFCHGADWALDQRHNTPTRPYPH